MTGRDLIQKAQQAVQSAQLLLENDDFDGAVDRSYYAMFHAARAHLFNVSGPGSLSTKTHRSVVSGFARSLLGTEDLMLGRLFSRAEALRLKADYSDGAFADRPSAEKVTADAAIFVERIAAMLRSSEG